MPGQCGYLTLSTISYWLSSYELCSRTNQHKLSCGRKRDKPGARDSPVVLISLCLPTSYAWLPGLFGELRSLHPVHSHDDAVLRRRVAGCRVLRAQDNRLSAFPPEFETLTALEELWLGGNRLHGLPISLEALQNVTLFFQHFALLYVCRTLASSISW